MANPAGTRANRWNQVVNAVSSELAITTSEADAWLNGVWANMYVNESFGDLTKHEALRKWLEFNYPTLPTLPMAFREFVV